MPDDLKLRPEEVFEGMKEKVPRKSSGGTVREIEWWATYPEDVIDSRRVDKEFEFRERADVFDVGLVDLLGVGVYTTYRFLRRYESGKPGPRERELFEKCDLYITAFVRQKKLAALRQLDVTTIRRHMHALEEVGAIRVMNFSQANIILLGEKRKTEDEPHRVYYLDLIAWMIASEIMRREEVTGPAKVEDVARRVEIAREVLEEQKAHIKSRRSTRGDGEEPFGNVVSIG